MIKLRYIMCMLLSVCVSIQVFSQQSVTRGQLLKLLYQAQQAQQMGNNKKEESIYKEIINLSPRFPEPYLRLGDIYKADAQNLKAQKKAFLFYKFYIQLGGQSADSLSVSSKMDEVQHQIALLQQRKPHMDSMRMPLLADIDHKEKPRDIPTPPAKKVVAPIVAAVVPDVPAVPSVPDVKKMDPVLRVKPRTEIAAVPVASKVEVPAVPVSDDFNGRWVSAIKDVNGKEAWILDMAKQTDGVSVSINEHSAVRKTDLFGSVSTLNIKGHMQDSTVLVFEFTIPGDQETKKNNEDDLFGTVGSVLENTLGINMGDLNLFAEEKKEPRHLLYNYIFRLHVSDDVLKGDLRTLVTSQDVPDVPIVDNMQECEFYRASASYVGLGVRQLSEKELADDKTFRDLFNSTRKLSETSMEAMNDLGCLYLSGIGTTYNPKKAMKCFATAALENLSAQLNLAELYLNGLGVERNLNKARNWYLAAAEKGCKDAYVHCGDSYLYDVQNDFNTGTALFYYHKAVDAGSGLGFFRMACLYKDGAGVTADENLALEYMQKAIDAGYVGAKYDLYLMYEKKGETEKAFKILESAAADNEVPALFRLSEYYLKGKCVRRNFMKAKMLEQKALLESEDPLLGHSSLKRIVKDSYKQMIK